MEFTLLGEIAKQYLNCPYIWGGDNFLGLDCSGFIQQVLREVGILTDQTDRTAQGIHDHFISKGYQRVETPVVDSILFFGSSITRISHIGLALNPKYMIHAGGGDSSCTSKEIAAKKDARVKISKVTCRKDLVSVIDLGAYTV